MNSLVVAPAPEETMSGVRTPVSSVSRTPLERCAALRSPRPSPSMSAVASSMALGLATPWPAISSAEPCVGEHALAVRADAARRDHPRALVGERGRARQRLGERLLAGDDVEPGRVVQEPGDGGLERRVLDEDAFPALRGRRERCVPAGARADRGQARPAAEREPEGAVDRELHGVVRQRADDCELAPAGADARDPPAQVELGLETSSAGSRVAATSIASASAQAPG